MGFLASWMENGTNTTDVGNNTWLYNGTENVSHFGIHTNTTASAAVQSSMARFSKEYQGVHGYISIVVCIIGVVSNIMNIVVLTRRNMITSTNYILTALAIADMFTMLSYLPYSLYFYCITIPDYGYGHPKGWIIYLLFNTHFIITTHTIAMWLTVALAVFRYIVVCHHTLGPRLCNIQRAKITIAAVFIVTPQFSIPNYIMYKPIPLENDHGGIKGYWFDKNDFVSQSHLVFNFWLFGVVLKVAPCVLLGVLSTLLIKAMHEADNKRRRLKSQGRRAESERANEHNRTTAMLVAVVLCFVITELPQGILAFLSGIDQGIFNQVYVPLGDIFDILVLINSAVNFLLYCIMSRQFRDTFKDIFLRSVGRKPVSKNQNGIQYSTINNTQSTTL